MDPVIAETLNRSLLFPELAAEALEKILLRRRILRPREFLLHAGHRLTEDGIVCSFWALLNRSVEPEPPPLKRCSVRLYRGGPVIAFRSVAVALLRREEQNGAKTVICFRTVIDPDQCRFSVPFKMRP